MKQKFNIDIKHQVKSLSNGLWNIAMIPVALVLLWFWKGIYPFDTILLIGLFLWTLFWFIPAIILHMNYYFLNRNTVLEIDKENSMLQITENGQSRILNLKELKETERIYYSDYRHVEWQQNWIPMPWRNYGLLRIETIDNQEFILTSLMIDIVNPPIKPTKNTFKHVPFPPKSKTQIRMEAEEEVQNRMNRTEDFKIKFKDLSISELESMSNSTEFVIEARTAAQELIKEKNTAANNVYKLCREKSKI